MKKIDYINYHNSAVEAIGSINKTITELKTEFKKGYGNVELAKQIIAKYTDLRGSCKLGADTTATIERIRGYTNAVNDKLILWAEFQRELMEALWE